MTLLVFEFLLAISETSLYSIYALRVKINPLLDGLQLLMFTNIRSLTYLEQKLVLLVIIYNGIFLKKLLCSKSMHTLTLSPRNGWRECISGNISAV
jgi:hypothetical protein